MSDDLRDLAERAGVPPAVAEHYGPLLKLLRAAMPASGSASGEPRDVAADVRDAAEDGLHPDHAYSSAEAARFLGVQPSSVAKISRQLLPRVRSGRFLGIDLLAYRGDVTPQDAAAYKEARRRRIREAAADDGRPPFRRRRSA